MSSALCCSTRTACDGFRFGCAALISATTPPASGADPLVPITWTYQECWVALLKQPQLVPAGGGPVAGYPTLEGAIVPGTPAAHAPRRNPVGAHTPAAVQPPAGKSPPGAATPCRLDP